MIALTNYLSKNTSNYVITLKFHFFLYTRKGYYSKNICYLHQITKKKKPFDIATKIFRITKTIQTSITLTLRTFMVFLRNSILRSNNLSSWWSIGRLGSKLRDFVPRVKCGFRVGSNRTRQNVGQSVVSLTDKSVRWVRWRKVTAFECGYVMS